jgi:hypothetical protein
VFAYQAHAFLSEGQSTCPSLLALPRITAILGPSLLQIPLDGADGWFKISERMPCYQGQIFIGSRTIRPRATRPAALMGGLGAFWPLA